MGILLALAFSLFTSSCFMNGVFGAESIFVQEINDRRDSFIFGASSAAYQYEGAAFEGGKGISIWDNFTHEHPEKIRDGSNGDVADDFYHRYKDDIKLMKSMGLKAFRFSISWPRILPTGKLNGGVNEEGVEFYNNVIDELISNDMIPFVTIFHWDLPQALEDEYSGFLSPLILFDYKDFAQVCFEKFGDRVKHWMTFNEPYIFINGGYDGGLLGQMAPGRCSDRTRCARGNSATEPYVVAHHQLLCHAEAVKLYRETYKPIQNGEIGIALPLTWKLPYSNHATDVEAARRCLEFMYGWFVEPVIFGTYPKVMRAIVGDRLPEFTSKQKSMLRNSVDFLGLNYYSGNYAVDAHPSEVTSFNDKMANYTFTNYKGETTGPPTGSPTLYDYPEGLFKFLVYTKTRYKNPNIYITENGYSFVESDTKKEDIDDQGRIDYYKGHIKAVFRAMMFGVKVKGFFAWSFLDNFEWSSGYLSRFGLYKVDRENNLERIPKSSALWFKEFLNSYNSTGNMDVM